MYWLRWEEDEETFGCLSCVEEKSKIEGRHYAYENNSILLFGDWDKIYFKKTGHNLQLKGEINDYNVPRIGCGGCSYPE